MLNGGSDVAPGDGAWRNSAKRAEAMAEAPRDFTVIMAEARRLIEGTTLSQHDIAQRLSVAESTISAWKVKGGWQRPEGAPQALDMASRSAEQVTEKRRAVLVDRLYRVFDRQLMDIEARAALANGNTEEKDARALGTLARTLGTLIALERDDGAPADDPEAEAVDPDEIRARLAQRLFGMRREGDD